MDKKELRKTYIEKRRNILSDEFDFLNKSIVSRFEAVSLDGIKLIHLFYPIPGKLEFNSLLLKESFKKRNPDIQYVLPRMNPKDNSLTNILWEESTPLAMNQWGITEPEHGNEIDTKAIDMIIIPLLAFDELGNRLGYGKGFYDRFLSECRADAIKAGVSFFAPENHFEEVDAFDIPLDICVTPEKIWRF